MITIENKIKIAPRNISLLLLFNEFTSGMNFHLGFMFLLVSINVLIVNLLGIKTQLQNSPILFGAILLVFVWFGIKYFIKGIKKNILSVKLLRIGSIAEGQFKGKEGKNSSENRRKIYKVTIDYKVNNKTYTVVEETSKPYNLNNDRKELILFDPSNPNYATAIDNLNSNVKINHLGLFQFENLQGYFTLLLKLTLYLVVMLIIGINYTK